MKSKRLTHMFDNYSESFDLYATTNWLMTSIIDELKLVKFKLPKKCITEVRNVEMKEPINVFGTSKIRLVDVQVIIVPLYIILRRRNITCLNSKLFSRKTKVHTTRQQYWVLANMIDVCYWLKQDEWDNNFIVRK